MKKENGITLIALVITIIILLILAGVSIATLIGENGLLSKANTAKTETKKASAEEQIKLAIMGAYDGSEKLDINKLKEELGKIPDVGEIRDTNGGFPIEVDLDGYTFIIDGNGNVTRKAAKPIVEYSLSTNEQVAEGTEVTVTITATIGEEETITKITKQGEVIATNIGTATFLVTTNGSYTVTVEGSNKETTTIKIIIANIGTTEIFSDIYTSTQTYKDSNNKTARIPEGFAVGMSSTINKIENGLVITDAINEDHKSIGNEFVWVPVESKSKFKRVEGFNNGERQTNLFKSASEPCADFPEEDKKAYSTMHSSVTNNKGFYIGRYETGKENNKAVVKKKKSPYDGKWANSLGDLTGGVVQVAKNFTTGTLYQDSVTSSVCYGVQWDAANQFFDGMYIDGSPDRASYVVDGSYGEWLRHNYKNGNPSLLTGVDCGSPPKNKMKNIYDMGGNSHEATMEVAYLQPVFRGGDARLSYSSGYFPSPSFRYYSGGNLEWVPAFRMTLSLKN